MQAASQVGLRPVAPEDLWAFQDWNKDADVTRYLGRTFDKAGGVHKWFSRIRKDPSCQARSVTSEDGALIGYVLLENISWRSGSGELKICLGDKDRWNQGYGTWAVKLFAQLAAGWGLKEILVRVHTGHKAAIKCYDRAGFRRVGVLRGGRIARHQEMLLMRCRLRSDEVISQGKGA